MLTDALVGLASAGGTALVSAMVTDGWEDVRARFAHVLSRGKAKETEVAGTELDQSRAALEGLTGLGLERALAEQELIWRARLSAVLEEDPGCEAELRALVMEVQTRTIGWSGPVQQHATAFDQAQQAVQGQGVQNVTFGGQREPGVSRG